MMRFVDLSESYWDCDNSGHPICAFLSTTSDQFVTDDSSQQTFSSMKEIEELSKSGRLKGLVPEGFFERTYKDYQDGGKDT